MSRDNYSYKKYQRELAKKKKAEEKRQRKLNKGAAPESVPEQPIPLEGEQQTSNP